MRVQVRFFSYLFIIVLILSYQTFPQTHTQTKHNIYSESIQPIFVQITVKDGLPENSVKAILQDHLGLMWIGTSDGLDRYDGRSFKLFKYSPDDVNSLGANTIRALYEDKSRILWVGTEDVGLNRYNRETENFIRYIINPNDFS